MKYIWFDFLLDSMAVVGMASLVGAAWQSIEVALYGFSQKSVVDTFFCVVFSVVVVVCIRLAFWIDDGEDGEK